MCGIVGIRRFDGTLVDEALLRTMATRLEHRGPDGEGYWADGPVGFGHRRLSIIDVAGSPQPMATPDGRYHLSFNGEILNYRELRGRLPYPFRTGGDTETILAAFLARGPDAVHDLDGQFAFALFDTDSSDLWLFRDRLGILPLYYYADERVFAFASEIKALLPALPAASVDESSLADYLAHGSVPAPHTLFKGIAKLPAGHRLRVGADGRVTTERYWSIPPAGDGNPITPADAVEQTAALLRQSVQSALVADVPVGAYLSGGVDSSLIVALMSSLRGGEGVETFSAGFGDPRHDELPYARKVSDLLGTDHHEVRVSAEDFTELWPRLTWHRDAPVSQPADIAVFRLAELARRHVKVVLSGEGSDELFAGYPKYAAARWMEAAARVPGSVRRPLAHAVGQRLPARASRLRVPLRVLEASSDVERYRSWFAPFTERERHGLAGHLPSRPAAVRHGSSGDVVRRMLEADCSAWLSDNLLERGDRMSMAASLELRPPFLDRRLVEFAFSLPSNLKVRRGTTKWIVKEVSRRYLPAEIVDRRKVGFRVPLDAWFRGGLRTMAWDLLASPSSFVGQVLDRTAVTALLERHDRGTSNEETRLWSLLGLEVWHDAFFSAPVVPLWPSANVVGH